MKYLFDTDHISFLQRRSGSEYVALAKRISQHSPGDFAFCVVSFHEQMLGAHAFINRSRTAVDVLRGYNLMLEMLQSFLAAPVLPFDKQAVQVFDSLQGQRIRLATMDLRIASIALAQNLILLTRNMISTKFLAW